MLVAFVNNNNKQTSPVAIEVLNKRGHCIIVGLLGYHRIKFLPLVPLRTFNITWPYIGKYNDLVELVGLIKKREKLPRQFQNIIN